MSCLQLNGYGSSLEVDGCVDSFQFSAKVDDYVSGWTVLPKIRGPSRVLQNDVQLKKKSTVTDKIVTLEKSCRKLNRCWELFIQLGQHDFNRTGQCDSCIYLKKAEQNRTTEGLTEQLFFLDTIYPLVYNCRLGSEGWCWGGEHHTVGESVQKYVARATHFLFPSTIAADLMNRS